MYGTTASGASPFSSSKSSPSGVAVLDRDILLALLLDDRVEVHLGVPVRAVVLRRRARAGQEIGCFGAEVLDGVGQRVGGPEVVQEAEGGVRGADPERRDGADEADDRERPDEEEGRRANEPSDHDCRSHQSSSSDGENGAGGEEREEQNGEEREEAEDEGKGGEEGSLFGMMAEGGERGLDVAGLQVCALVGEVGLGGLNLLHSLLLVVCELVLVERSHGGGERGEGER
ncbi:hypothetical protein BJY59DRAFT_699872 [Rhodotorula toruloides]